jgi:Methyltransferase domain
LNACRNCGSTAVRDLGFIGEVAPFFLKRVFNMEIGFPRSSSPRKRLVQTVASLPQRMLARIRRTSALVEMEACTSCTFVQTKHPFDDEALGRLYRDYRSESYNRERIHYEPAYQTIAAEVGAGEQEMLARIESLTAWIGSRIAAADDFSMLDYGGADGRFLPRLAGRKYVYEISGVEPAEGIVSIRNESDLGSYSYIQLAHIMEHVPRPLELVRKVSGWLEPGGHLYIEVPQDFSERRIAEVAGGSYQGSIPIHEHINLYTRKSVVALIEAAGLCVVDAEVKVVNLGWIQTTTIRALGRRS